MAKILIWLILIISIVDLTKCDNCQAYTYEGAYGIRFFNRAKSCGKQMSCCGTCYNRMCCDVKNENANKTLDQSACSNTLNIFDRINVRFFATIIGTAIACIILLIYAFKYYMRIRTRIIQNRLDAITRAQQMILSTSVQDERNQAFSPPSYTSCTKTIPLKAKHNETFKSGVTVQQSELPKYFDLYQNKN